MNTHGLSRNERTTSSRLTSSGQFTDLAALFGRVTLALIFLWSGYGKLVDITGTVGYMNAYHVPLATVLVWPAALLEVIGGLMLVTGWKARWAAIALAGFTVISALIFHNFWAVPPEQALNQTIHFMKNIAIMGGLLQVFAWGAGRYAIDRPCYEGAH